MVLLVVFVIAALLRVYLAVAADSVRMSFSPSPWPLAIVWNIPLRRLIRRLGDFVEPDQASPGRGISTLSET